MNVRILAGSQLVAEGENLPYSEATELVSAALAIAENSDRGGLRLIVSPEPLPPFSPDAGTEDMQQPAGGASKSRKKALK